MREVTLDIPVAEKLGEGLVAVQSGDTLDIDVRLESVHEGILVSAEVTGEASGECGRCLRDIRIPVEVEFQELFAYSSDEAFDYEVHDDHVDLEPLIRDTVVLSLPFQPVCTPDCPGLDPVTGERLADHAAAPAPEVVDPRWSALASLRGSETSAASRDTDPDEK
ncbi:YceD family protein [Herbiconiux daphne]|uniref:DUF177 domain-containing protein n=1 Tax=Herbiconiux daphne TaxID=2970914 RepID=A0ABT2H8E1_9MICO|nr:DUF177 domain-containing protein [Herbiconiux daphne]MCS5736203.1 DUF177 domain-containing protein [Herbiconiux daphne]